MGNDLETRLTQEEIKEIRELIWKNTGIYIDDNKLYLIDYKISPRIRKLGMSPKEYIAYIKDSRGEREFSELINLITIGETQFFRDKPQIDVFFDSLLKEYVQKNGVKFITALSAGCATGEEPYTLSIYLMEKFPLIPFKVYGVDINEKFVEKAKQGIYSSYSLRGVPPNIIFKYFDKIDEFTWQIKDIVKRNVVIERVNLMDRVRMKMLGRFDFIFCKNVIIYFDMESRDKLAQTFWSLIKKGGYLVLGPAERIQIVTAIFEPVFINNMFFYKKPEKEEENLLI